MSFFKVRRICEYCSKPYEANRLSVEFHHTCNKCKNKLSAAILSHDSGCACINCSDPLATEDEGAK